MNPETKSYEAQMLEQLTKCSESLDFLQEKLTVMIEKATNIKAILNRYEWCLRFIAGAVVLSSF